MTQNQIIKVWINGAEEALDTAAQLTPLLII
jgi:hypothetical protein